MTVIAASPTETKESPGPAAGVDPEPGSHRGILFAMCLALVLVVGSVSAINLALPDLAISLGAGNSALTWIADGYTVALAALVLPLGALGDRYGRRRLLVAGTVVFGLASVGASTADTANVLIAWRVAMGVGAAMIMPGTLSTITATFPPEQRARGVATWSGFAAAGAIIGLLAAGALLERWGWSSIFVASAAAAAVAGIAAQVLAPDTREKVHRRFDLAGSVLLAVGIGALVFAIIEGTEQGWTQPITLVAVALAIGGLVGYVVADLRHENPILDPRLFALAGFRTGSIAIVVQFMAVFGFFFVGIQYLQLVLEYSPLGAAVALIPVAVVVLPAAQVTPRLVDRFGLNRVMAGGLLAIAAGMVWIARLDVASGYGPFVVGLCIAGVGIGLASSTGTSAIVGSLPTDRQGVASAVNDATREVGSSIGIAIMGSVYGSHYASALPATPAGTPGEIVDLVHGSAAAGIMVADRIGGDLGSQLAVAVRIAFMDGLRASLLVVAVVVVVAAVAVLVRAPRQPTTPEP
ncbi:MAG: MFS transporter [Aquihabitans sp.]